MSGAGALRSTVHDLLTFLRAHLEPESSALPGAIRLAQQPRATVNEALRVGLGWHLSPLPKTEHVALWHNGGTGGTFSYLALVPEARVGVVVLTNTAHPADPLGLQLLQSLAQG